MNIILILTLVSQVIIDSHNAFTGAGVDTGNDLLLDLVGYWKADEVSGDFLDSTGQSHDLSEFGTTAGTATGVLNNARTFYGSIAGDLDSEWNEVSSNSFTFNGWIYMSNLPPIGSSYVIATKTFHPDYSYEFIVNHDLAGNKNLILTIYNGTYGAGVGLSMTNTPTPDLAAGTWYMVSCRYNNGDDTAVISYGTSSTLTHSSTFTSVGGAPLDMEGIFSVGGSRLKTAIDGSAPTGGFDGRIDEFALWKRYLSNAELTTIFDGGTPPLPFTSYTF